jgi:hypothetical protein
MSKHVTQTGDTHTTTTVIRPAYILILRTFISSFGIKPVGELSSYVKTHFGSARKAHSQRYVANSVLVASRRSVTKAGTGGVERYCRIIVVIMVIVMQRSTAQMLFAVLEYGSRQVKGGSLYSQSRTAPEGL